MEKTYIVAARRTPIGKFGKSLAAVSAVELGAVAIEAVVKDSGVTKEAIDQVLMGNVIQAGAGQNPARQAAIKAGLDYATPAITINDVCGSGLSSVNLAASLIQSNQAQIVIAGGMESMSRAPYILNQARGGYRFGDGQLIDALQKDALIDVENNYPMGITAENVAELDQISRQAQDEFALRSHQKAVAAQASHAFDREIVPVEVPTRKGTVIVKEDEAPRADTSLEALQKLKPSFTSQGTVTAGNASGLNDGAAAVMLASESAVKQYGLQPLAEWQAATLVGIDPAYMGLGPAYAIEKLFKDNGISRDDIDLYEINEAFASQSVACLRRLKLDEQRVNPRGGALALGHPVGCSGARILVTLIHEMQDLDARTGIASLCIGGGMGVACLIEKA
ncbi:acetyl-CoA C-acetyltransferase [Limosilactobacillus mucosae]|uniref:thiolase family protein n=1 Tax=Limosilactobacillus mucosae TaxID=97478 RepID=UPI00233EACC1|nr:acetyl-CoA C-acetyltransferase [Limosilactobacillus mucosae]MDC2840739.1 acetyl-CoA C-acetyltransferase [Limosilactobacillus mucosae]MDC2845740.1 acetyl-CoA C-acetyltransferase [Limosilactobacillus mucosae]